MPPKKKYKPKLKLSENAVNYTEVKFFKNPVTIKQRMENARSMKLFNANYEDDLFDHINNNDAKNKKLSNYFKLDLSSSSLDTLEESDCSSNSFSSPHVVHHPPLRSSACQSETPAKYKHDDNKQVSPIKR